jgi:hypothetical protein
MSEVDDLISQFSGYSESHWHYNHTVELRFDSKSHTYCRVTPTGLIVQDGVSTVCKIIDKSNPLMNWACSMMAQKILLTMPRAPSFGEFTDSITWPEFERVILGAKMAHKDKLDEASNIGKLAHSWIEQYIKICLSPGDCSEQRLKHLNTLPDDYQAANCCEAAIDWMDYHNIRWIHTEKKVYSLQFGYAGTLDGLCIADSCDDDKCCRVAFKDRLSLADWKSSNQLNIEYLLQTAAYQQAYQEEYGVQIDDRWIIRLGKEDGTFEPWHISNMADDFNAFRHALYLTRGLRVIESCIKEREDEIRVIRNQERKEATQAALAIKCYRADTYKGVRKPRCNGGNPCETCLKKYQERHQGE